MTVIITRVNQIKISSKLLIISNRKSCTRVDSCLKLGREIERQRNKPIKMLRREGNYRKRSVTMPKMLKKCTNLEFQVRRDKS